MTVFPQNSGPPSMETLSSCLLDNVSSPDRLTTSAPSPIFQSTPSCLTCVAGVEMGRRLGGSLAALFNPCSDRLISRVALFRMACFLIRFWGDQRVNLLQNKMEKFEAIKETWRMSPFPGFPPAHSRQRPFPPDVANGVSSLPLSHSDSFNYKRMRKVCY